MRFLLTLAACSALTVSAFAQQQRMGMVKPDDQVSLAVNETRVFRFVAPYATVVIPSKGVIGFSAISDRMISITGEQPGSTAILLQDANGQTIYNATVTVNPATGRIVKIYGGRSDPSRSGSDYTGYYCTDTTCSRADRDLNSGSRESDTVTIRRPLPDGGFVETTKGR